MIVDKATIAMVIIFFLAMSDANSFKPLFHARVDYPVRSHPRSVRSANLDGDSDVNVADLSYLVDYVFKGGPAPPLCP